MAKQIQFRRGTTVEHSTFTGVVGEVTVDTTKDALVVHDGTTVGGIPAAREDHTHTGTYEPADTTILKDADIGVTVQAYDANIVSDSSYVHTDNNFTTALKSNYDTAYGWGNHASAGYLTSETNNLSSAVTWTDVPDAYKNTNTVYAISGTAPAINPDNGMVQTWGLTGNSTPTDGLANGQMVELHINDGSGYTITWTMVDEWIGGSAPTLDTTNTSVIFLEKIGSTVIGRDGGVAS